ncbi:hypothetical protein DMI69_25045 [Escherichia coli]|nr:hypothetical protein [Escherichia coli]
MAKVDWWKLRGDLDQLIESDPKLRALRPHLKIGSGPEGLRIQIIDSQNRPMFVEPAAPMWNPICATFCAPSRLFLNGIPNRISLSGHTDDLRQAVRKDIATGSCRSGHRIPPRTDGWRAGMVAKCYVSSAWRQRCLSDRGPDDAVNRRISLLVPNKHAEQAILHETPKARMSQ